MDKNQEPTCPNCGVSLRHLHNEAHGIPGTHMAGSERYECPDCDKSWYKNEGEKLGFKYIAD